jgi:hypothetical protein
MVEVWVLALELPIQHHSRHWREDENEHRTVLRVHYD